MTPLPVLLPLFPLPPSQALIINRQGEGQLADGPQRVFVWRKSFQKLQRLSANQKQFIRLQHSDGNIEHLPGPCSLFLNPLRMESADIKESYSLDANEVLVVYQRERESGGVLRRVQHGPTVFTPSADEW